MLLSLVCQSRGLRRTALLAALLMNAAGLAFSDSVPSIMSVSGQCPDTTVVWSTSPDMFLYMYILMLNGNAISSGMTPSGSMVFSDLSPGSYSIMVQGFGPSGSTGFSSPYSFTITACVVCKPPVIQMASANPNTLWPPNGQIVPVLFNGSVTTDVRCPLSDTHYVLHNSQGSDQQGPVSVGSDGSFQLNLFLQSQRDGGDRNGRVYSLTVESTNQVGSTVSSPLNVTVPHDQR
jgi:hypothetical protein